jgi:hypothetical protein
MKALFCALSLILVAADASAQPATYTGFIEARGFWYFEEAPNDPERLIGDALFRQELVLRPARPLKFTAGLDLRHNTYNQVEDEWRLDFEDRGLLRPRAAVRQLSATIAAGWLTLDVGKQFVRWGRADIIYPTDRFAPRDYLNVIDPDLLPIIGARAAVQVGSETFEAVWVPQLTPSRLPLLDQRWAPVPAGLLPLTLEDDEDDIPDGSQIGGRWRHVGSRVELAASVFDGFNHLPDIQLRPQSSIGTIEVIRVYPAIRMYGGDVAVPTQWLTLKGEVARIDSVSDTSDEYVLYVIEIERQVGEWLLDVGYAGEVVRESRVPLVFSPDRSMAKSVIGRALFTGAAGRRVLLEGAVRQEGSGFYARGEFSESLGQYWRFTLMGVGLGGDLDDFLGQYQRNSHVSAALRVSF